MLSYFAEKTCSLTLPLFHYCVHFGEYFSFFERDAFTLVQFFKFLRFFLGKSCRCTTHIDSTFTFSIPNFQSVDSYTRGVSIRYRAWARRHNKGDRNSSSSLAFPLVSLLLDIHTKWGVTLFRWHSSPCQRRSEKTPPPYIHTNILNWWRNV